MKASSLALILLAALLSAQTASNSGLRLADMDPTCKPCDDFWRYANGGWIDKNPIPAHASSWGPFNVLREANSGRLKTILETSSEKMGDLYASCMDTAAIDAAGMAPLQPDLNRVEAIKSMKEFNAVLTSIQLSTAIGPFQVISSQDRKNPNRVIANIGTALLSLPDRDYYFKDDQKSRDIREAFLEHVATLGRLAGVPAMDAKAILALETQIASAVMTIAERRDPEKTYHLMDAKSLRSIAPNFDWQRLLRVTGVPNSAPINIVEPEFLKKTSALLGSEPLATWKSWLRWRLIKTAAPHLSTQIFAEDFRFDRTILEGVKEQRPRSQACVTIVDQNMGDDLGKAYVAKFFPPEAKQRMATLVEDLRATMREELERSAWMEPETKKNAIRKLDALTVRIGYPDRWKDYAKLSINRAAYFQSIRATGAFTRQYDIAKIGKPVRRDEWRTTAPTVNAFANSLTREIIFPAGILQSPFFDLHADNALNYGAIGAVIGHEIGHQFDDSGSKFDATGALKNWWTEEDRKRFDARATCVADQFNNLDLGQGLRHNGKQVLGEALGDLGGLSLAYKAYKRSMAGKPEPAAVDGFTADQRFFIAFARVWGAQYRDDAMRLLIATNNHPVSKYRAIATLQNMPEFHRAFQCKQGDAMVRPEAQQCKLW
jgi:predicted metalloendopeptidase